MAFLNPLFLLGALAAAVPILLHLIKREHASKIEFPTLMFLRKVDRKTIRYQKLRHLLLLLFRVLAFLFIALAFMRPYLDTTPASAPIAGSTGTAHVILLDNSMSMSYQNRWDKAKTAARDVVRQSRDGDKFALLEFSDSTRIQMDLSGDDSTALNAIRNAQEPGDQPTRYAQALKVGEEIARKAGTKQRVIHLISDFQKNEWTDEEREFRLGSGIELKYVDVGSDEFSNLAIRNVQAIVGDPTSASNLHIKASLAEYGSRDRANVRTSLNVDGRVISEKTIHVAGKSAEEFEFQVPSLSSGEHSVVLEVADSYLTRDNRFYITIDMQAKTPVVVVENSRTGDRRASSFFLAKALNVNLLSPYQVKAIRPQNLELTGKLLIWNDTPVGSDAVRERLKDFVNKGGGLIVVLGTATESSEFNRSFGTWLPVKMEKTASRRLRPGIRPSDDFTLMTFVQTKHPIFQLFDKPYSGTFSSARFYSYSRIIADAGTEVLARFDTGDPALISIGMGKGRILIFASSADDTGNDLPLKAVYAPFWQQMLRYLESRSEQRNWLMIGDVLDPRKILYDRVFRRGANEADPGTAIALLDPAKKRLEISPGSESIISEQAGFYDVRSVGMHAAVAVNTIPAESDLTHQSAKEMTTAWTSSPREISFENDIPTAEEKDRSHRIWIFLLLAALLFLISELFLSNKRLPAAGNESGKVGP